MQRVHIIGRKNHGKTTLVVELVQEMNRRGLRTATIKHTHHRHELDTPGKDSYRHRLAGAAGVGILSPELNACFWPATDGASSGSDQQRYAVFDAMFSHCDWVLVEGDTQAQAPKLEVWRRAVGANPMAAADPDVHAVITDDQCNVACPVLRRSDVPLIVDWMVENQSVWMRAGR